MFNLSLRLPYLIYLSIGSMLFGVLVAPVFRDVPAADQTPVVDETMAHDHVDRAIDVPRDGAPEIAMTVTKDPMGGWNIALAVENFTFTPGAVNGENAPNTGHAHLYVGGQKVARLYSAHFHLPDLPLGQHEITVALNSYDHSVYVVDGVRVEARAIVQQEAAPFPAG